MSAPIQNPFISSLNQEFDRAFDEEFDRAFDEEFDRAFDEWMIDYEHLLEASSSRRRSHRRRAYIDRGREEGHARLWNDYFSEEAVYSNVQFRQRFRMNKSLFLCIVDLLSNEAQFFQQRPDATGRLGLSALQKCTAAIRMLAYGCAGDSVDEYIRLGESTTISCLNFFVDGIISLFGDVYLRRPTSEDLQRLLHKGEMRGFPSMMGSIDCMHWEWKNCPTAWKGTYSRGHGKPTIVLEAVASYDLWIWHAFFGTPGTCNDINVLDRSPIFDDILQGRAPEVNYVVNGNQYNMGYYLTDGIYPSWATFIQSIQIPQGAKATLFAQKKESVRKDVEHTFGVLQARFAIVRNPALCWNKEKIGKIMRACVILHNIIVEDERDESTQYDVTPFQQVDENGSTPVKSTFSTNRPTAMGTFLSNRARIRNTSVHQKLKADLVENIWQKFGTPTIGDV